MWNHKWSRGVFLFAGILVLFFSGCQSSPDSRLQSYLGSHLTPVSQQPALSFFSTKGPLETGLIVINDASGKSAAPVLSPESFAHMKALLQHRVSQELPLSIVKDLAPAGLRPGQDLSPILAEAERNGLAYVLVAILSSEETRYPTYLPFNGVVQQGGGTRNNPGYETQNFALMEFALLNVQESRVMLVSDGTAWATLYTLDNQLKSNVYPVVVRALQVNPIYPDSYSNASDILRAVSADDAMKQAVQHFQEAWYDKG